MSAFKRPQIVEETLGEFVRVNCNSGSSQDWGGLTQDAGCAELCLQTGGCSEWVSSMAILTESCLLASSFMRRCFFQLQHLAKHSGVIIETISNAKGERIHDQMVVEFTPGLNFSFFSSLETMEVSLLEKPGCQAEYSELPPQNTSCSMDPFFVINNLTVPITKDVVYEAYETKALMAAWSVEDTKPMELGVCSYDFAVLDLPDTSTANDCFSVELQFIFTGLWAWTWDSTCAWASLCDVCESLNCPQCHWSYGYFTSHYGIAQDTIPGLPGIQSNNTSPYTPVRDDDLPILSTTFHVPSIGDTEVGFCGMPALVCENIMGVSAICSPALVVRSGSESLILRVFVVCMVVVLPLIR